MWVLLLKMVPSYYPKAILVHLPSSEVLLGSLGGPKIAPNLMKIKQK